MAGCWRKYKSNTLPTQGRQGAILRLITLTAPVLFGAETGAKCVEIDGECGVFLVGRYSLDENHARTQIYSLDPDIRTHTAAASPSLAGF